MAKKGYCENESLGLAWDRMGVCQVGLFTATMFQILLEEWKTAEKF